MKIMHDSEAFRLLRSNALNEVITPEQRRFEASGLAFIANVDLEPEKPADKEYVAQARRGWQGIRFGNAYDRNGNPLPHLKAMYGLPWYR